MVGFERVGCTGLDYIGVGCMWPVHIGFEESKVGLAEAGPRQRKQAAAEQQEADQPGTELLEAEILGVGTFGVEPVVLGEFQMEPVEIEVPDTSEQLDQNQSEPFEVGTQRLLEIEADQVAIDQVAVDQAAIDQVDFQRIEEPH